jgi:hypothetical protein
VVWNLNTTNTYALDPQATVTDPSLLSDPQQTEEWQTIKESPM